jgi:hypothetical protein
MGCPAAPKSSRSAARESELADDDVALLVLTTSRG